MRSSSSSNAQMYPQRQKNSNIVQFSEEMRVGRLVSLQGVSDINTRTIDKTFFYNSVASFLAYKHFNERRGDVLPWLPHALKDCDFYFSYEFRDTHWSRLEAARQLALATGGFIVKPQYGSEFRPTPTTSIPTPTPMPTIIAGTPQPTIRRSRTTPPRTEPPRRTLPPRATAPTFTHPPRGKQAPPLKQRKRIRTLQQNTNYDYWNLPSNSQTNASTTGTIQPQYTSPLETTSLPSLDPFAIFGAYWSSSTKPLSMLSGGLGLPHVSGASTSAELERISPMFARTVASNDGDAQAAILYYQDIGVTHLAVLFIQDSWGNNYHASLQKYANSKRIALKSFAYDKCCVETAIANLRDSQYRHIFAIMHNWKEVIGAAHDYGIIGSAEYSWMGAEEKKWTGDAFQVSKDEAYLAHALHGIGTINIYFELVPAFEEALEEMAFNPQLQEEYVNTLADPSPFEGYDFPRYDPTGFTNSIFDGVLAMGLAACKAPTPLFTAEEFYDTLIHNVTFSGVSGQVAFDPSTGNRQREGMRYSIEYVVLSDERTTDEAFRFDSQLATVVGGDIIYQHAPFVYFDNTTNVPPSLPPIDHNELNLVSKSSRTVGYIMGSIVIAASLGFLVWVMRNRNLFVVRASQPIFLGQLCVGCFIMALYVFPASLPGASTSMFPDQGMDIACMSQLWLAYLGFVTAFSAVLAKTYRLNRLMNSGNKMRRIQVEAHDVMGPFAILMVINVTMLLCITFVTPYRYQRIQVESYDRFGRSTESYGTCRPESNFFYLFLVIMVSSNGIGVLVALIQTWKARLLPTEFSESYYLALSIASYTETFCLGGPILVLSYNSPTAWYLLSSSFVCIGCMTILLPIMLPKYAARHYQGTGIAVASGRGGRRATAAVSGHGPAISGLEIQRTGCSSHWEGGSSNLGRGYLAIHRNASHNNSRGSSRRSSRNMSRPFGGSKANSPRASWGTPRKVWGCGSGDRTPPHKEDDRHGWGGNAHQVRLTTEQSIKRLQRLSESGVLRMSSSSEGEDEEWRNEVEFAEDSHEVFVCEAPPSSPDMEGGNGQHAVEETEGGFAGHERSRSSPSDMFELTLNIQQVAKEE